MTSEHSTSITSLEEQVSIVHDFADSNFLNLNFRKFEIIPFSCDPSCVSEVPSSISGLPVVSTVKCLGYWWSWDLFASKSIDENIYKARRAFFCYGSIGAFQGDLNPLSSKAIIDTCVMPILLFGSENWILSDSLMYKLEKFLGELSKRALKWPKHLSNTCAVLILDMESIRCRILCQKLNFLKRLLEERATGVGAVAMRSLSDDMESLCLVKECRELELYYGTNLTDIVLTDADTISRRAIRKILRVIDRDKLVEKCSMKSPSIACIIRKGGSWPKLWDSALHLGSRHTIGLQNLSRLLVHHGRALHPCPLCDEQGLSIPIIDHVISAHKGETGLNIDLVDRLLLLLVDGDIQLCISFGNCINIYCFIFSFLSSHVITLCPT